MKAVDVFLICVFTALMSVAVYVIDTGLHDIRVSSFRIGCMSVDDAPYEAIRNCQSLAELKVGQ